jgi:hypothetical protein
MVEHYLFFKVNPWLIVISSPAFAEAATRRQGVRRF